MKHLHHIVFGRKRGRINLPDYGAEIYLNPIERTLYRLFLAHPEGIMSENLLAHWKELCLIYLEESCFDDKNLRDNSLESLCSESKTVFYSTVSRIKRKFVKALGARKAGSYIIKRNRSGVYKTTATL